MLDYLISLLSFEIEGTTYNLLTTPWGKIWQWALDYQAMSQNRYSTALLEAYTQLGMLGIAFTVFVIVLIVLCCWFVYKLASGFTGWMRFR